MNLTKSHWVADENHVSLSVPFSKVDQESRTVSGWATLDNVDTSDDVVLSEASARAFARFRGNIREMHQPIAAGRIVDFKEESFYDSITQKFYSGIFVTAYVSKGAEATWQKVLDGTLSGFSIGGNITDQSTDFSKEAQKVIRFIKDYDLYELSLVDNPANQLANVFSIVKNAEGTFIKGMVAETEIVNVFWCLADEIAKNSTDSTANCMNCGNTMEQIGWFERGEDAVAKTAQTVAGFLRQGEGTVETTSGEGGVKMTDEIKKDAGADVVTSSDVADVAAADEAPEEVVAEAEAEVAADEEKVEEADTEPDIEKMFDNLRDSLTDSIQKTVESVEKRVSEVSAAFDEKTSEFEKSLGELSEKLESIKTEREDVAKRLDVLEKSSAIKKSGEVETEPVKKNREGSLWAGTFLN